MFLFSYSLLHCILLNEEDKTSPSCVYIKKLFLELVEFLGLTKINNRLTDPTLIECFQGFFVTDELREFIKSNPISTAVSVTSKNSGYKDLRRIDARRRRRKL